MRIRFITPAKHEYIRAIEYYNSEKVGLGYEFAVEVENAIKLIEKYPAGWQRVSKRIRKFRLHRFPYGLLYEANKDEIIVIAVMHLHRRPNSWKNRI